MELTILHLYPDCMSLYGEYANLLVLREHLEKAGITVRVESMLFEDTPDFAQADLIYMGAGTERTQKEALAALLPTAAGILLCMLFTGVCRLLL